MTLRRTPMTRKTPMARGSKPMPRRKRERAARVKATIRRQRDTGPTPAQRSVVAERAGYRCELCGRSLHADGTWITSHSFHHRQARGAGGTRRPEANAAYNLLLTCGTGNTGCHGDIESNRRRAEFAGWLVRHGIDPADVPVEVAAGPWRVLVLLTASGDYAEAST